MLNLMLVFLFAQNLSMQIAEMKSTHDSETKLHLRDKSRDLTQQSHELLEVIFFFREGS